MMFFCVLQKKTAKKKKHESLFLNSCPVSVEKVFIPFLCTYNWITCFTKTKRKKPSYFIWFT